MNMRMVVSIKSLVNLIIMTLQHVKQSESKNHDLEDKNYYIKVFLAQTDEPMQVPENYLCPVP